MTTMTATNAHTCDERYTSRPCRACFAETVKVGDFVQYTMVTDTRVYEVVGVTSKTLRLRATRQGESVAHENRDGNPFPIVYRAALPMPGAETFTVRLRKDGSFRIASWANPIRFAQMHDGVAVTVTDYRF